MTFKNASIYCCGKRYTILKNKGSGIEVKIKDRLGSILGKQMKEVVNQVVKEYLIDDVKISVYSHSIVDFALEARLKTTIKKYLKSKQ